MGTIDIEVGSVMLERVPLIIVEKLRCTLLDLPLIRFSRCIRIAVFDRIHEVVIEFYKVTI
jgi:hypothetical protein